MLLLLLLLSLILLLFLMETSFSKCQGIIKSLPSLDRSSLMQLMWSHREIRTPRGNKEGMPIGTL